MINTIKFIDLFAGIGGLRLGFEQAVSKLDLKAECVLSSEIDEHARQTYEKNFGEWTSGDISTITDIPDFDVLLAGFPCQPFSYAGSQKGFADTRGTMFFEIERFLKEKLPKMFILENVRGLLTHDKGRTFDVITSSLREIGYKVDYRLLNSASFGLPQNRTRLFILGSLGDSLNLKLLSNPGAPDSHAYKRSPDLFTLDGFGKYTRIIDILEDSPSTIYDCSPSFIKKLTKYTNGNLHKLHGVRLIDYRGGQAIHSWELGLKGDCTEREILFMNLLVTNRRRKIFGSHQDGKRLSLDQMRNFYEFDDLEEIVDSLVSKGYLSRKNDTYNPVSGNMSFEVFKFLDPEGISITLTSSDSNRIGIFHNDRVRRITPRECARLQGFPDSFILHDLDHASYKQFGNSVSVPVVKAVAVDLLQSVLQLR